MQEIEVIPSDLDSREPNTAVKVLASTEVAELNPHGFVESIIWGWKRDQLTPRLSRTIYFSGRHVLDSEGTWIENPFFFYAHWGTEEVMEPVAAQIKAKYCGSLATTSDFEVLRPSLKTTLVRITSGKPTKEDLRRLGALASRQPDPPSPTPPRTSSESVYNLRSLGITGCDLLAGSGLSYESGLPMLKEVHDLFWVDDNYQGFCLGAKDLLPSLLTKDLEDMFRQFAGWHVKAAKAHPSEAHKCLFQLRRSNFLHDVYTDNIDKLFVLAGFDDCIQVRGSGVVNEFFPVHFHADSNALLVVGVSADRRGIIAQARQRGLRIIVINPYLPVSPGAKNLDYLQSDDIYYGLSAGQALPKIVTNTLGHGLIGGIGS